MEDHRLGALGQWCCTCFRPVSSPILVLPGSARATNEVAIYILTNSVHTDIVVPVKNEQTDWSKEIKFVNAKSRDATRNLLASGWGDKGFT